MSNTIDRKTLEMRFDSSNFERNVNKTISSLEKLKQSLRFKDATKGMEKVSNAAKNIDFTQCEKTATQAGFHIRDVWLKVSEVFEYQIARRIINSATDIAKALTITPITTGFNEYELKMNSVQTIMASTGESIDVVNKYLNELNEYSDQTIYSFQDMTSNIGKFTNAGVKLEDAVLAIKGISNEAAVSGANANEASRAMYNFAQALSAGHVKLLDWKSIELANMATKEFKQQLIDTAVRLGTVKKAADGTYKTLKGNAFDATKNFNETLSDQWMTTEVLVSTLKDYADESTEIGKKAKAAATEVKTFTQMMDTLKESAQSGWAQTWELIIGDLEEAKALWTRVANFFGGIISAIDDTRNKIIGMALSSPFGIIMQKVDGFTATISNATSKLQDYSAIVDKIIRGDYGNGVSRWNKLTEEGYDWAHAQNLVNERLGDSTRHATNYSEVQEDVIHQTEELTDAKLRELGLTEEEIRMYRMLEAEAKRTGKTIQELADEQLDGRTMLIESFARIGTSIKKILESIGNAWLDIFPAESVAMKIYNAIKAFYNFSENLVLTDESADKLRRTFRGVFAIIDIVLTLVSGPVRIAFKLLGQLLGAFDLNILDVTAILGDAIVKFRDWMDSVLDFTAVFKKMVPYIQNGSKAIRDWIATLKTSDNIPRDIVLGLARGVKAVIATVGELGSKIGNKIVTKLREVLWKYVPEVPRDIILGLINGLSSGFTAVGNVVKRLGEFILTTIKNILGIHSPSKEFFDIGVNIIKGLIDGISSIVGIAFNLVKTVGTKIIEFFNDLTIGDVISTIVASGFAIGIVKMVGVMNNLTKPLAGLGNLFDSASDAIEDFGTGYLKLAKGRAFKARADGIRNLAIGIALLAGSLYLLSKIETNDLIKGGIALGGLIAAVSLLAVVTSKIKISPVNFAAFAGMIIGLSVLMLAMGSVIKKLSFLNEDNWKPILGGFVAIIAGFVAVLLTLGTFTRGAAAANITAASKTLFKIASALLVMTLVLKLMGSLKAQEITVGIAVMTLFSGFIVGLLAATKLIPKRDLTTVNSTLLAVSGSIAILAVAMKLLGTLDSSDMSKGLVCITGLGLVITGLIVATKLAPKSEIAKISATLLAVSGSIAILALTMRVLAGMSSSDMGKGVAAIAGLGAVMAGLILATRLGGKDVGRRMASTLLMLSISIGILAGIAVILGLLNVTHLAKGITAVVILTSLVKGLMKASSGAQKALGGIIAITTVIAVMAGSVALLSLIDTSKLMGATTAMVALMLSLTLILKTTRSLGYGKFNITPILSVVGIIAALAAIVAVLAVIPVNGSILEKTAALTLVVGAVVGLTAALGVLSKLKVSPASITPVLLAVLEVLGIIALVVLAVGAIALIPGVITLLDQGIIVFQKVGEAIGALVGGIIGGIGLGVVMSLVKIGDQLSLFMKNVQPFLDGMKQIDSSMVEGALGLVTIILGLAAANVLDAIGRFFSGGQSIDEFGEKLADFGACMLEYAEAIDGIEKYKKSMKASVDAAKAIVDVANEIPNSGGWAGTFAGENDIDDFADKLKDFGEGMLEYGTAVYGIEKYKKSMKASVDAAKDVVKVAKEIPESGGWAGAFAGENDIDDFADKLEEFGEGMVDYGKSVKGIEAHSKSMKASVDAAKDVVKVAEAIPNSGGMASWFAGNNNIDDFGDMLEDFGDGMLWYGKSVNGISAYVDDMKASVGAAKAISDMAKELPNSGGMASWFAGDNDLGEFADNLSDFGEGISDFGKSVKGIDGADMDAALEFMHILEKLNGFEDGAKDTRDYITVMATLGNGINEFYNNVKGISASDTTKVTALASAASEFLAVANTSKEGVKITGIDNIGELMSGIAEGLVSLANSTTGISDEQLKRLDSVISTVKKFVLMIGDLNNINDFGTPMANALGKTPFANPLIAGVNKTKLTEAADTANTIKDAMDAIIPTLKELTTSFEGVTDEQFARMDKAVTQSGKIIDIVAKLSSINNTTASTLGGMTGNAFSNASMSTGVNNTLNTTTLLEGLADGISAFAQKAKDIAPEDLAIISDLATTTKPLSEMINDLDGVKWDSINASSMATVMGQLGAGIRSFVIHTSPSNNLSLRNFDTTSVDALVNTVAKLVPLFGNLSGVDYGSIDADKVKTVLGALGEGIGDFASGIGSYQSSTVDPAVTSINNIIDTMKKLNELDVDDTDIGTALTTLGSSLVGFANTVSNISDYSVIDTALLKMESISSTISKLAAVDTTNIDAYSDSIVTLFENIGEVSIDSFVQSFTNGHQAVVTASNALAEKVESTIKTKEWEKKFKAIGSYVVDGIVKGINENTYKAEAEAKAMADAADKAARKALGVKSPSRKFALIGQYVVEGLANGIKDNVGLAEETSSSLGLSLLDAIQKELGINSPSIVFEEKVGRWIVRGIAEGITKDMSAEEAMAKKAQNIQDAFKKAYSKIDTLDELNQANYDHWLAENPKATDAQKYAKQQELLNKQIATNTKEKTYALSEYLEMKKYFEKGWVTEDEVNKAWIRYLKLDTEGLKLVNQRNDLIKEQFQKQEEAKQAVKEDIETRKELDKESRDLQWEIWQSKNPNATVAEKSKKEIEYLTDVQKELINDSYELYYAWKNAVDEFGASSTEAKTAFNLVLENTKEINTTSNEIRELEDAIEQDAKDSAESKHDLAQSIADTEYNIWEKTLGKNATEAEKDTKKLESLTKKMSAQTQMVDAARSEWLEAKKEFGADSVEALEAYDAYLDKEYELAYTNSDIIDIQERNAKRQKDQIDRQKIAERDYKNYIERYKDYYLKNGMTLADLERDAMLTSGYDPNSTVDTILSDTNKELNNLDSNSQYQNIQNSASTIGSTVVSAINDGVKSATPSAVDSAVNMSSQCVEAIKDTQPEWIEAGNHLVDGFAYGIQSQMQLAIDMAEQMATKVIAATNGALGINSPSKVFAVIGKYADMGLAKGLIDNSYVAEDAANNVVNNLRNSIQRISELVESDIDTEPTIRPVLDLSNVESGTARLNTMFSRNQALRISTGMYRNQTDESQNGNNGSNKSGNTYEFNQYNYSPKALSRTDIYRQTKNQFATMKEVLK